MLTSRRLLVSRVMLVYIATRGYVRSGQRNTTGSLEQSRGVWRFTATILESSKQVVSQFDDMVTFVCVRACVCVCVFSILGTDLFY